MAFRDGVLCGVLITHLDPWPWMLVLGEVAF